MLFSHGRSTRRAVARAVRKGSDDDDEDGGTAAASCEATAVACEDSAILELNLQDSVAPGLISNTDEL